MNPVEFILMFSTGFVAFVLMLSGGAKSTSIARTLESMVALRVPAFARARWIAVAVSAWEIGLGIALFCAPGWYRSAAALLSICTFAVFTFFIIRVLRRGEVVDCGCFGPLSFNDQVTGWTVARNVALMLLSAFIAVTAAPRSSFVLEIMGADGQLLLSVGLAWALVTIGVLTTTVVRTRRQERLQPALIAPATAVTLPGDRIPDAELVGPDNVAVPLHALGYGSPVLLVFLSAECASCAAVARRLDEWQEAISPVLLRVATSSRPDILKERMPGALPFAYFGSMSAKRALGVEGSAVALLLGGSAHPFVASPAARGEDEIDALVDSILDAQSASLNA
ncbi:MauE/DoxX family redox-associated membrane protein [Microbacterium sp.]|uniref:MauE/DoxX family redox-associated membrane protein n=1 Tax=Microbacterium sp. TaxID=51671 RepID=UPI0035234B93